MNLDKIKERLKNLQEAKNISVTGHFYAGGGYTEVILIQYKGDYVYVADSNEIMSGYKPRKISAAKFAEDDLNLKAAEDVTEVNYKSSDEAVDAVVKLGYIDDGDAPSLKAFFKK